MSSLPPPPDDNFEEQERDLSALPPVPGGQESLPPAYGDQQPPQYQQPGQYPQPGQYQQPGSYQQGQQYQQPPQYQQPGPYQQGQQYQQPQAQSAYYNQPVPDPLTNITLNYWLSVFFSIIPALIFYFIAKDKVDSFTFSYHRANLNFSILRTIVSLAAYILGAIPYVGWVFSLLVLAASLTLFVFQILAAVKAPNAYRQGEKPPFIFNVEFVK